jgi:hypothetical protein
MRLIAVTSCTDRKRFPVPVELNAGTLPQDSQSAIATQWCKKIGSARPLRPATDVYCGRNFREACLAAHEARADLRIISGGLGLIRGEDLIPSYSLSLVRGSSEFIGARVVGRSFDPPKWWRQIQRGTRVAPLAKLIHATADAMVVIGISNSYLPLICDDLKSLSDRDLDRVRLIGMSIEDSCPARLQHCILPYDDRLDGADSPIPGTRGDFSSRAMRHFVNSVFLRSRSSSLEIHKSAVKRCLSRWRRAERYSRQTRTDDEIIELILKSWRVVEGKSSFALRYLRDVKNVACEQGRFRLLFLRAKKQRSL